MPLVAGMAPILSSLRRICSRGLWRRVVVVLVSGVIFGVAVFVLWIQPREAAGANYAGEFAWDQLVAGIVATALVIVFGSYTVEQVKIARIGLEQEREADQRRIETETRRVLGALLDELDQNRTTALYHEGRLHMPQDLALDVTMEFKRDIYDGLRAGSLWSIPGSEEVLPSVGQANWEMKVLTDKLRTRSLGRMLIVGVFLAEFAPFVIRRPNDLVSRQLSGAAAVMADYVLMRIGRLLLVLRQGYPARTRKAIESAMKAVHQLLHKEPIDWETWNKRLPDGFQVTPQ